MFDLIIKNGTVVDGSGSPPRRADVAVVGDRIVEVGRVDDSAKTVIDAEGHIITPGFIDGHTHMDAQVMWDPVGSCSCWHGVTTVVMGNCGFTLAPVRSDERHLVLRNLERAEDIPAEALANGLDWKWETFPEYLDAVERVPKGINYAAYLGHSALRTWAMGERAMEERATDDDLSLMSDQLDKSLRAGAVGFTTTRAVAHATPDGRPVASRIATWEEVRHLVGVMARAGHGIFQLTPGPGGFGDPDGWDENYELIYALALSSGVPTTFGLFGPPEHYANAMRRVTEVNAAGGRMFLQTHSRGVSNVMSLLLRLPFDHLPVWRDVRSLPLENQFEALRRPDTRRRLVQAANYEDYGQRIGTETPKPNYHSMVVLNSPLPPNPTVADLAKARGIDPVEVMIDLMLEHGGAQFFVQPLNNSIPRDMRLRSMKHPDSVMTFSDSGAHVTQIMDASIHTHFLAHWTRDEKEFTLEEAVRMITSTPARYWGFTDRGLVREGHMADLNVFDPERVAPVMPIVTADLPGRAKRLTQKATGFLATVVGGRVSIRDGDHTGAFNGRLIRSGVP